MRLWKAFPSRGQAANHASCESSAVGRREMDFIPSPLPNKQASSWSARPIGAAVGA